MDDADADAALGGFYKVDKLLPFLEADLYRDGLKALAAEVPQAWAPQVHLFRAGGGLPMPAAASGAGAAHHQACTAASTVKEVGASYYQTGGDHWREDALR